MSGPDLAKALSTVPVSKMKTIAKYEIEWIFIAFYTLKMLTIIIP